MPRVLVTGATGFTGHYLVQRLARDGHEVHGIVRDGNDGGHPLLASAHVADLRDHARLNEVVTQLRPEWVVHLAAIAFIAHDDASELYSTNILGTRNLLNVLAGLSVPPSAILLASSANVYGNRREGVLTEDMAPAPANDYGITKAACEMLAQIYAERLPIIVVRPFNYTGLNQDPKFIVPKIVAHAKARKPVIEIGNIDIARDFSDVRGIVDCYARLLQTPDAIGGLFNICSGHAISLSEIISMVAKKSGHQMKIKINPAFVRQNEVKILRGSQERLKKMIGPLKMPPIDDTISWMLEG